MGVKSQVSGISNIYNIKVGHSAYFDCLKGGEIEHNRLFSIDLVMRY